MTVLKGLNLAKFAKAPLPAPRVIPVPSAEAERLIREDTQSADAVIAVTDAIIDSTPGGAAVRSPDSAEGTEDNISNESDKLTRLVDDNFPFDESQLTAVYGMVQEQYACMIGAAGTGKTTVERKLVDLLRDGLDEIDMSQYWKRGNSADDDDYEIPEKLIPNILMCSFTGRSTQMTKKNFPRDWHGNIMTIHRALGFYPEFFPDVDPESGQLINKRRFVPAYTAENKMPWKIIIIDEAGMLGLELWHQLLAACEPDTRIYMIGDIQQLPPTHGKSILGFALANWPTWELTHVHRQQGSNNSIVDNAHRILKGLRPVSDSPVPLTFKNQKGVIEALNFMVKDKDWRFLTVDIDDDHRKAGQIIRQALKLLQGKLYEPNRDVVITPTNGFEQTSPGYSLGQSPMNQALVTMLNSEADRYFIDAGRERQNFAVGDKVMATMNDYEAGVTNGMTGIITSIEQNAAYIGDTNRWGRIEDVNAYFDSIDDEEDDEDVDFDLDEMVADSQAGMEALKDKEKKNGGPASHIITVRFGEDDHAFEIPFGTKSGVASLMLAYVATCHKLQGGEAPLVFGIVHQSHKRMLEREWFYTQVTRASQRCVVFCTRQGLGFALGKQSIKGKTLAEKIKTFTELTKSGPLGPTVRVKLPKAASLVSDSHVHRPPLATESAQNNLPAQRDTELVVNEPQAESQQPQQAEKVEREEAPRIVLNIKQLNIRLDNSSSDSRDRGVSTAADVVDGGELEKELPRFKQVGAPVVGRMSSRGNGWPLAFTISQPKLVSQYGAYRMLLKLTEPKPLMLEKLQLPPGEYDMAFAEDGKRIAWAIPRERKPEPPAKPVNKLGLLLAKQKAKS